MAQATKPAGEESASASISHAAPFSLTVDHPRLIETDAASIRTFLRKYDQYVYEVQSRARQVTGECDAETVRPVDLKFCIDVDFLESSIDLGFIEDADSYETISEEQIRAFLEGRAKESKEVVTLSKLDKIISDELRTNMKNTNATARMQDLFAQYHTILRRNGLKWIIKDNQKVAVGHVLSAIQPPVLKDRLTSDLSFSHHHLKKDFKGFLLHAIELAKAFQLVDCGPRKPRPNEGVDRNGKRSGNKDDEENPTKRRPKQGKGKDEDKDDDKRKTKLPLCLWEPHNAKGIRHLLKDCPSCPQEEKNRLLQARNAEKAKTGPAKSTRAQLSDGPKTTGRLTKPVDMHKSPSCPITVCDGLASLNGTGRCDDGSDESIASPNLAHRAVLQGIGRLEKINPISIQVALTTTDKAEEYTFSRVWKVPRLIMELSSGRMALNNISFLISDAALSSEDLLIGLPVLKHLGIDSRTLLEQNRAQLDGTDCSTIPIATSSDKCGSLGRLMIARLERTDKQHAADEDDQQSDSDDEKSPPSSPHGLDPARPRSNYYRNRIDDDPFPNPNLMELDGPAKTAQERSDMDDMFARAKANGLPEQHWQAMESLISEYADCFSTRFSSTPSKVDPLEIRLTAEARPVRVKLRNYSPSQRLFMKNMMDELISYDIIYPNPSSAWACAPLIVPKAPPAKWRFTVDLQPVNKFTIPFQFPMPVIDHELHKTRKSTCYGDVDFTHSFWQLGLHPDSQECQSIITPDGIFSPRRVFHGTTNAVLHLQSFLTHNLPQELRDRILLWVDDCLFPAETPDKLIANLRSFFAFCRQWQWLLNPRKCNLFRMEARWCGRLISPAGVRHDPSNLSGLTSMDCPTTGGQLQQFLCAMQWLRSAIPDFQALTHDLHEFLEHVYSAAGKRTKRAVARISLARVGWTPHLTAAFERCKHAISERTTLAHRDETKRLCIYTDASDAYWSGIITQVPRSDLSLPHVDQAHEPLAFYSGRFTGNEVCWSTIEKEAYAVVASVDRAHWLASCSDGFELFTDHNNLIFIFDPLAVKPDINMAATRKVLRWAVRLSCYNYVCSHISGDDNVWADLLTRWSIPQTIRRLVKIPPLPTTFRDFEWPSADAIRDSHSRHRGSRPSSLDTLDGLLCLPSGAAWIPDEDTDLQLRLCIIAHTGAAGHRGVQATLDALRKHYAWTTMNEDVQLFVSTCIHCLSTSGGGKIPRPFGPAVHGTSPNDLLQFDYLELGLSRTGEKYVLMLRDDHSGYCWLYPSTTTDASTAADALLDWCAAFGAPSGLMSDGPTHFRNETIRLLSEGLRTPHHFTQPYCPWSNGAIERLGKEILRVARSVLSELQMRHDDWPQLIPLFQSALNNAPSPSRNNVAPVTAFTGRHPSPPISTFIRSNDGVPVTLSDAKREALLNTEKLVSDMEQLHPMIDTHVAAERDRSRKAREKGDLANFVEGDYVLVAREEFHEGEKLCLRWRGPRRVTKAMNDYVFQVEDLRNDIVEEVHGTRLKFYSDSSLDEKAVLSHVLSSETGMPVSRLLRLQEDDNGRLHVVVRWKGLSSSDDTFEPIERVYEDVPKLLRKLLNRKVTPPELRDKAHVVLGL